MRFLLLFVIIHLPNLTHFLLSIYSVLWSMAFGASGMGMAANWVAAAAKGKAAAVRVFELFDRKPPIDSKPWNSDGSPRDMVVPSDVNGKKGEIEFRKLTLNCC